LENEGYFLEKRKTEKKTKII